MAQNKVQLSVDIYQNKVRDSKMYGKWYGKAVRNATLNTRGLAAHIAQHGSLYTIDVVEGVLRKLSSCIPELVGQGVAVKVDGLGTFYPTLRNKKGGAESVEEYDVESQVDGVRMRYLPDGAQLDNITSRAFKEKCMLQTRYVQESTGTGKTRVVKLTPVADYIREHQQPQP